MFRVMRPRWPPGPYMVKTFQNLLWNQKADDLGTWYMYTASGTQVTMITKYVQMMTLAGLTLIIFMTWSNLFRNASA